MIYVYIFKAEIELIDSIAMMNREFSLPAIVFGLFGLVR